MKIKAQLNQNIQQLKQSIDDYQQILERLEVEREPEAREFVENRLQFFRKRMEMFIQCFNMYQYLEETMSKEEIKEVLKGEDFRNE